MCEFVLLLVEVGKSEVCGDGLGPGGIETIEFDPTIGCNEFALRDFLRVAAPRPVVVGRRDQRVRKEKVCTACAHNRENFQP